MPVFSNVVSDLSPIFFENAGFLETLQKISKASGVNIIVNDNVYKLQGLWLGMVKAHSLLDQISLQQVPSENDTPSGELIKTKNDPKRKRKCQRKSPESPKPPIKLKLKKFGKNSGSSDKKFLEKPLEVEVFNSAVYDAETETDEAEELVRDIKNKTDCLLNDNSAKQKDLRRRNVKKVRTRSERKVKKIPEKTVVIPQKVSVERTCKKSESIDKTSVIKGNTKIVSNRSEKVGPIKLKTRSTTNKNKKRIIAESVLNEKNEDGDSKQKNNSTVESVINGEGDEDSDFEENLNIPNPELPNKEADGNVVVFEKSAPAAKLVRKCADSKTYPKMIHTKLKLTGHKDFMSKRSLPRTRSDYVKSAALKVLKRRGRPRKYPENAFEFPCEDCDFVGKTRKRLAIHREKIHLAKPVKCEYCEKIFPNEKYLKRHISSHQGPQHCCEVCGKKFKILKALNDHRRRHEDGYVRPQHPCEKCGKTFCNPYILECHIKAEHEGQKKSYLCSTCGKSLTTKHALLRHVNAHMGIKPYPCEVCGKRFSYESGLKDHKNIHSNIKQFSCPNCRKSFSQRAVLKMHMRIHKDTKDFKCPDCGRGFTQKQALQRHQRVHKGEKPFTCKLCERSFIDASIIRKHLILFHKIHKDAKTWREDIICSVKKNTAFYIDRVNSESEKENGNDHDLQIKGVTTSQVPEDDNLLPTNLYQNVHSNDNDKNMHLQKSNGEPYVRTSSPINNSELTNEKPTTMYQSHQYKTFVEPVATCSTTTSPEPVHVYSPDESIRPTSVFTELHSNQTQETRLDNIDEYNVCRVPGAIYYEQKPGSVNVETVDPHRTLQNVHTAGSHISPPVEHTNRNQVPDTNDMYSYSSLLSHYSQLANYYISAIAGPSAPEMSQNSHTQYPVHQPTH